MKKWGWCFSMVFRFLSSFLPFFLAGVAVASWSRCELQTTILVASLSAFVLDVLLRHFLPRLQRSALVGLLAIILGGFHGWRPPTLELPAFDGAFITLEGRVQSTRIISFSMAGDFEQPPLRQWIIADASDEKGRCLDGNVTAIIGGDGELEIGDQVRLFGWLRRQGNRWRMKARLAHRFENKLARPWNLGPNWRRQLRQGHFGRIRGFPRRVLDALVLGRNELRSDEKSIIRKAGVSHLFAVSGLHLVLVCGMFGFALRRLRVPDPWLTLMTMMAATCFAILTGLQPPMTRALGCLTLYSLARLTCRPINATWSLLVVASLEVLRDPTLARSLSFQLSFAAVTGLLWLGPRQKSESDKSPLRTFLLRKKKIGAWRELIRSLLLTSAAIVATAPLTLVHFGTVAPIALLTSLAFLPLIGTILALGLVDIFIPLPTVVFEVLCQLLDQSMRGAAECGFGFWEVGPPQSWAIGAFIVLILWALTIRPQSLIRCQILAWIAVSMLLVGSWAANSTPRLVLIQRPVQFAIGSVKGNDLIRFHADESNAIEVSENLGLGISFEFVGAENQWKIAHGRWQGEAFIHFGIMPHDAVIEFCKIRRREVQTIILPSAGKSAETTAFLIQYFRPQKVVCERAYVESFMLAQRAGCKVIDGAEFNRQAADLE